MCNASNICLMALHFPLLCYSSVNVVPLLCILCSIWSENEASLARETSLDIESRKYDSSWAVQLKYSANENDIRVIAITLGLGYRQILPNNYYLLTDENSADHSDEPNHKIIEALKSFPKVLWVEQQIVHENDVRESYITDPLWEDQEYLKSNTTGFSISHHVKDVWMKGYTGKGITVAVIDDGVRGTHRDFENRYNSNASFDIAKGNSDSKASHGTKCAGVIAAGANNGVCGVGVAYNSEIAGIRLFGGTTSTDAEEAQAFYKADVANKVDIFSSSWGPKDNGYSIRGPGRLAARALKNGTTMGRNGLGSIYVFSAGNGGQFGDSCAFDGYVNDIHTIAVTSVARDGNKLGHSEACAAVMTAVYSTDMVTLSSESDTECVGDFGKSSAAAAFLSGIIALTLEANRNLTWRDVQHLIARSSTWNGVNADVKRVTNGNNFTVSEYLGFGVLDALTLINEAKKWNNVPEQLKCTLDMVSDGESLFIPNLITKKVRRADLNCPSKQLIEHLEHVQLRVDLNFTNRAVLAVYVKSPSGTNSKFIYPRLWDSITGRKSYSDLVVTSLHFWGESVIGEWSVNIAEDRKTTGTKRTGRLFNLTLIFYGTSKMIPVGCTTKKLDILLIMDDSRSITNEDYNKMKNFAMGLVKRFDVSQDHSHVALMQFSETPVVEFHLDRYYNKNSLTNHINAVKQRSGTQTFIHLALKMAREKIFNNRQGDRSDVRDVIILLTDGHFQDNEGAIQEARLLRDNDISLIPVAVGDSLFPFQRKLSLGSDYVFKASFTELDMILNGVRRAACENLQEM